MSTIQDKNPVWPGIPGESLTSKYEKCRNITEEIYKRINITFQIKSLETASQSDVSDHNSDHIEIDSNELSNGTDLFAYEKSDTISSSEHEDAAQDKLINLNNNEIKKSVVPIYKPPRKRFRKKVKKRHHHPSKPRHKSDSSASSDEALPLSRVVEPVPKITILTSPHEDPKIKPPPEPPQPASSVPAAGRATTTSRRTSADATVPVIAPKIHEVKECTVVLQSAGAEARAPATRGAGGVRCNMCSMTFKAERGLRRHVALSHILIPEAVMRPKTRQQERGEKTA